MTNDAASGHPLSLLACPGCGSSLTATLSYKPSFDAEDFGILECDCSSFPVVAGIPIIALDKIPHSNARVERICRLIRSGKHQQALIDLVAPEKVKGSANGLLKRWAPGVVGQRLADRRNRRRRTTWNDRFLDLAADFSNGSAIRLIRHYFDDRSDAANYFAYRAGQPKYLVTAAVSNLAPAGASFSLDIGCGAGHFTRLESAKYGPGRAFGVDSSFFLLWLAQTRTSPDSIFVCCDVELGLPFRNDVFDFALLSNFFHFIFTKAYLLQETDRVCRTGSAAAITSLRHRAIDAPVPNIALSLSGYRQLVSGYRRRHEFVAESAILNSILQQTPLPPSDEDLHAEALIDLLLADQRLASIDLAFEKQTPDAATYRPNPLYIPSAGNDGSTIWNLRWPSDQYLADNPEMASYFPKKIELSAKQSESLNSGQPPEELRPLIRIGALVDLPDCY